jgi:hypothetical protein
MKSKRQLPCPYRVIATEDLRRRGSCLCIETGITYRERCTLKPPDHWVQITNKPMVLRWLGSGGSALVLGICNNNCPDAK